MIIKLEPDEIFELVCQKIKDETGLDPAPCDLDLVWDTTRINPFIAVEYDTKG